MVCSLFDCPFVVLYYTLILSYKCHIFKLFSTFPFLHLIITEGIKTAKLNGKQIGRIKGNKYTTKKETTAKEIILK